VITGDLDRLLAAELSALGGPADGITPAGTWQPAPAGGSPAPGSYATPVALRLAGGDPARAARVAMTLAAAARQAGWVRSATVLGGYLTVSVTADALAALAVRITQAGPACARSTALAGTSVPAPRGPGLAAAPDWAQARRRLSELISGRLAEAAGARILPPDHAERESAPTRRTSAAPVPSDEPAFGGIAASAVPGAGSGPVADAVAFAGSGAISYTLARIPPGAPARADPCLAAAHHLGNPAYAVRYAHAHAAGVLRQAADLGLGLGEAAGFQPRLLAHPTEQWLLDELSWLPERVAGAARRARPDVFARYLERLADAYFDCQEACPAMGPGVQVGGPVTVARLWLAAAAGTALRAGLGLLGVDAPARL
jgi:arginyl-tRNA synthetase